MPGLVRIPVNNPEPNQSTVSPDLGIQNDGSANQGAWLVDQEGGIDDGSPYFYDYLLDWSGPGGHSYISGFNYRFAPFGRHDVSSNSIVIAGCSANTQSINPPIVNDPVTAIWYIFYLLADETAEPGDLYYIFWGDQGSPDPPQDDPDQIYWFHTADVSGGMPGQEGDPMTHAIIFLMPYSNRQDAPPIPDNRSGDLGLGFWAYPYLTAPIWGFRFPEYTTRNKPAPLYQAFDVSDPSKCRLAADNDSYLTFTGNNLAVMVYMLDSLGNWYGSGFEPVLDQSQYWYIGLANSLKIRTDDPNLYISGATAVDLEMLPTITYLYDGDYNADKNWCAVLFKQGSNFVVRVYRVDWTVEENNITIVDTTDPIPGNPIALDVDYTNFRIHVLAEYGGQIEATVFEYTP